MSEQTVYIVFKKKKSWTEYEGKSGWDATASESNEVVGVHETETDAKYRIKEVPESERYRYYFEEYPVEVVADPDR